MKRAVAPVYARRFSVDGDRLRAAILCFHEVGHGAGALDPIRFREHLCWLSDHHRVVPLDEVVARLEKGPDPHHDDEPMVAVTFDDGYKEPLDLMLDVLDETRISATAFVSPALLGAHAYWRFDRVPPLWNESDVERWLRAGHSVGSHSLTHSDLTIVTDVELQQEVELSKAALSRLGVDDPAGFAYPWGKSTRREVQAVKRAGYRYAVTASPGTRLASDQIFEIPRLMVDPDDSVRDLGAKIRGGYDWTSAIRAVTASS